MNIAETFIRRPVMTTLCSLAIVLFGLMAYRYLPVNDLPNVDFPTIDVSASPIRPTSLNVGTTTEIDAMGQRLQVARLVNDGVSYQEISRRTGASTATVTRVAQWLHYGEGGYAAVLKRSRR